MRAQFGKKPSFAAGIFYISLLQLCGYLFGKCAFFADADGLTSSFITHDPVKVPASALEIGFSICRQ